MVDIEWMGKSSIIALWTFRDHVLTDGFVFIAAQLPFVQGMCLETNQTWNSEAHGTGPHWMATESIPTRIN